MTTLDRWDPFRDMAAVHNELSRFMNALEGNGRTTQSWVPALDISETEHELVYSFEQARSRRIQIGAGTGATIEGESRKK